MTTRTMSLKRGAGGTRMSMTSMEQGSTNRTGRKARRGLAEVQSVFFYIIVIFVNSFLKFNVYFQLNL